MASTAGTEPASGGASRRREADGRRARRLEYFTVGWNVLEFVVAVAAGLASGSVALLGFGIDSAIESSSAGVLLWRFSGDGDGREREEAALRGVGVCFFLLAAYVLFEAVRSLILGVPPDGSMVGIVLAAVSVVVMPVLARAKRRVAAPLESRALVADSRQTDLCAYLSAILLVGLVLNAWLGWWWADPVAALAMVPIITNEGLEAWRGDGCECHP